MSAILKRPGLPPIFPSMSEAEAAARSLQLRRDAALNRRAFDRQAGFSEPRDQSRDRYLDELTNAGLHQDAATLADRWEDELEA
jgi:hypothetical protein